MAPAWYIVGTGAQETNTNDNILATDISVSIKLPFVSDWGRAFMSSASTYETAAG